MIRVARRVVPARFVASLAVALLAAAPPAHAQGGAGAGAPPPDGPPVPKVPSAPAVPTTYDGLFAERDARAQAVIGYVRCLQQTVRATRSGQLGSVSPAWSIACIQQGREWRGVLVEVTDGASGVIVHRQYALRGAGVVVREPVDTVAVSAVARAMRRGLAAPLPGRGVADFMPVALLQKGYTEVWFLPTPDASSRIVIGGDSVIQMTEDGTRELGHANRTPSIRILPALADGTSSLTLPSREERLPLVSELVAARLALPKVADVRIRTAQYEAMLSRATGKWTHIAR